MVLTAGSGHRRDGLPLAPGDWQAIVWRAIEAEVSRDRPIWELQKLLDGAVAGVDDFVEQRIGVRGELSLEHTFRLLSLVIDPAPVRMAYHGILLDDEKLKSVSLEYLEQVLPTDIRKKLWPFIGDVSTHQRDKAIRSMAGGGRRSLRDRRDAFRRSRRQGEAAGGAR